MSLMKFFAMFYCNISGAQILDDYGKMHGVQIKKKVSKTLKK